MSMPYPAETFDDATKAASDQPPASADDRRAEERYISVRRPAKLIFEDREQLCLLRNVSTSGLMAEVYDDLEKGEKLTVEFVCGFEVAATIAWVKDGQVGMQFDAPVPREALLMTPKQGQRVRAPRFHVDGDVNIHTEKGSIIAQVTDISLGGAKISGNIPVQSGARFSMELAPGNRISGTIRWRAWGRTGLQFDQPMTLDRLGRWMTARSTDDAANSC